MPTILERQSFTLLLRLRAFCAYIVQRAVNTGLDEVGL
jgi:hypothetical protein